MFTETLYKTENPRDSDPAAEFYQLGLETVRVFGETEYRVIEMYGWWDDSEMETRNRVQTLRPEIGEGYPAIEEALRRYEDQKKYRARSGFVHLFRLEVPSGLEVYELLAVD